MAEKSTYSIRELQELSGIPAHTLRTWERRYGLLKPVRDAGNTRCYTREVLGYVRDLAILLKQGHRISFLASKSREEIASMAEEYSVNIPDDLTAAICLALQDFRHAKLEQLVEHYIRKDGFDKALEARFVPFLEQLSVLLLSGVLKSVHVQMFCGVLRQKIFAHMDLLRIERNAQTWLLIHGKMESESIHRDIIHYLLRRSGKHVISLDISGHENLRDLCRQLSPDGCCLVADGAYTGVQLMELVNQCVAAQGNTLVFSPGKTLDFANNALIPDLVIIKGLHEAFHYWSGT